MNSSLRSGSRTICSPTTIPHRNRSHKPATDPPSNPANQTPCFRTTIEGYPTGLANPANVTAKSNLTTQARYIPKDLPTGYVQAYHLTVQRQLGPSTTLEASYVGSHGVKLQVLADLNQAEANPVTSTCNATVNT